MSTSPNQAPAVPARSARTPASVLRWMVAGEIRPALLIAAVLLAWVLVRGFGLAVLRDDTLAIQVVCSAAIGAVFIGVVVVSDVLRMKSLWVGIRTRGAAGAIAFAAIATIFGGSWTLAAVAAAVGAVLGAIGTDLPLG